MTGRSGAPFFLCRRWEGRVNLTAKLLVAGSCLVIFSSLLDIVRRTPPAPQRPRPETTQELVERIRKLRQTDDPNDMGPRPRPYLWQQRLVRATDYAALAESALPAARAGNADAQFALYGLYSYCRDGLRKRTPAELEQFPEIMMRDMHAHCDALAEEYPDLVSEAGIWLTKSLESKFPRALVITALEDIKSMARKPPPKGERIRRLQVARENLLQALQSNDPAITEVVPEFLPALFPGAPQVERAQWIWRLAACEQGLDCGPRAQMVLDDCRMQDRCIEGETAPDYIRRVSGDFPSLTARARNLARALRKSQFDAKTFDESVTSVPAPNTRPKPTRILERS
jgi:hypothetical protein